MGNLYYDVKLDIQKDVVKDSGLRFTQGDSQMIYLRISVLDGGMPFDAKDSTASICFVKPDGTYVVGTPVESGNVWIYRFLGNELQFPGKVLCDVKFSYESGRISSSKFTFVVEKDTTIPNATVSTTYIGPMEEMLAEMNNYKNQGISIVQATEEAANGVAQRVASETTALLQGYVADCETSKNEASGYADNARQSAVDAQVIASNAASDAFNVSKNLLESYETNCNNSKTLAAESAKLSESWAVGETGTRTGENTDNAKYYSSRAEEYWGKINDALVQITPSMIINFSTGKLIYEGSSFEFNIDSSGHLEWRLL